MVFLDFLQLFLLGYLSPDLYIRLRNFYTDSHEKLTYYFDIKIAEPYFRYDISALSLVCPNFSKKLLRFTSND